MGSRALGSDIERHEVHGATQDQSGTRRIEASRIVVLEMVKLAAMRSVSCMVQYSC